MRRVDLNLFRVFDAVMQHRSVSAAARELGVTASAVSHALARLRRILDDELFAQGAGGMEPSPRALELAPDIRAGLARMAAALGTRSFAPATAIRTFRIAASDYAAILMIPALVRRLAEIAPHIDLRVVPAGRTELVRLLDAGQIDAILGWFGDLPGRFERAPLVEEHEAMLVRRGHPLLGAPPTADALAAYPRVVVEFTGTDEHDETGFLNEAGVNRRVWIERMVLDGAGQAPVGRVAVTVPSFVAVPPILETTDMIACLPNRLANRAVRIYPLERLVPPWEPLRVTIEAIWHERAASDPGLAWFVEELRETIRREDRQPPPAPSAPPATVPTGPSPQST